MKPKLVRITTIPESLDKLLEGQLRFMNEHFDVIAISSNGVKLRAYGEKEGIKTHCIELTRKITPIKDLLALWNLYWFLKTEKPLIVHTHTPKAGFIGMLASFFASVPIRLHTVAGLPLLESFGIKRYILNKIEKLTYACSTMIYPNSNGLREIIVSNKFCNPNKLKVVANGSSNGIDIDYFDSNLFFNKRLTLRKDLGILPNDFVYIFVGRLVADKGINELIHAFIELFDNNKNVKLLLVGNFEHELDPLNSQTLELIEVKENIIFTGIQKDVRPFFYLSDVLVFPSYREGFPNVVLQALSMGLPAIVSDINGCNELIKNNINGLIVPPKEIEELKLNMLSLYQNKKLYNSLKKKSRSSMSEKFLRITIWNALLEEYKILIKEIKNN